MPDNATAPVDVAAHVPVHVQAKAPRNERNGGTIVTAGPDIDRSNTGTKLEVIRLGP